MDSFTLTRRQMLEGAAALGAASSLSAAAFAQETPEAASSQWRAVADQIRPKVPKLAPIMDEAETDVLAYLTFPRAQRGQLQPDRTGQW